ncbi:hypothetical protein Tco_0660124, partial [Tanacetum coccineum]
MHAKGKAVPAHCVSSSPSDPYSLDVLALVPVTVVASEPVLFGGQTFVAASSVPASL